MFRLTPKDPSPSGSGSSGDSSGSGSSGDSGSCNPNLFCKAFSSTPSKTAFCSCDVTTDSTGDNPDTLSSIFFKSRQITQSGTCASK